jgi:hypothetical protein
MKPVDIQKATSIFNLCSRTGAFSSNSSYVGDGRKGYSPLYAIGTPNIHRGYYYTSSGFPRQLKELISTCEEIPEFVKDTINLSSVNTAEKMISFTKSYRDALYKWFDHPVAYEAYPNIPILNSRGLANFDYSAGSRMALHYDLGRSMYSVQHGCMFQKIGWLSTDLGQEVTPLWCTVVKTADIPLIRRMLFAGERIPNTMVEFWVSPELDTSNGKLSRWKSIRTLYRKRIKPKLIEKGIKIVEKNDIMETLFNQIEVPTFTSPKQYKSWLASKSATFLADRAVELGIIRDENNLKRVTV